MSKRFGRNQKRRMREEIAAQKERSDHLQQQVWQADNRINRLRGMVHYFENTPVLMTIGRPVDKDGTATFCIAVNRESIRNNHLDSRQLYQFIANELSRAVLDDPLFRGVIVPDKRPSYDFGKILEF